MTDLLPMTKVCFFAPVKYPSMCPYATDADRPTHTDCHFNDTHAFRPQTAIKNFPTYVKLG